MKDSQDWLDIDEVLENLWYEASHDAEPIGSAVGRAKSAIREHFLKEAMEMIGEDRAEDHIDEMVGFRYGYNTATRQLRNKFNDKYKED